MECGSNLVHHKPSYFWEQPQCRRCKRWGFDPWVGKILWRREWQPIPVEISPNFVHHKPSYFWESTAMQKMQGMRVWSVGWEDPLKEGMATHSSILAWKIPWIEEAGGLQSDELQSRTQLSTDQYIIGSTINDHWKDWGWSWSSSTLATWCEELTHWKRPWCWERIKTKEEEQGRRWNHYRASPIHWIWIWANSRR